jgi:uncharacterized membrane protein
MMELIGKILPGVAEMQNLHPMVVHFPIALLNGFLLMEVLGFIFRKEELRTAARWMLYLGTLGAMATVAFGLRAESTLPHNEAIHEILLRHKSFGITVLVLSIVLSVWRILRERRFKTTERVAHMIVAAVMLAVMTIGADMGGLMVYKHGAGVKAVPMADGHDHSVGDRYHHEGSGATDLHNKDGHDQGSHKH